MRRFLFLASLLFAQTCMTLPSLAKDNTYQGFAKRFVSGATNTRGSIRDRLIEGAIEASTPQADAKTRRLQRTAAKLMLSNDRRESQRLWSEMHENITDLAIRNGRRTASSRHLTSEHRGSENCKIVNVGILPAQIKKAKGCLSGNCKGWEGSFDVVGLGSGMSGAFTDYPIIIDTSISVTIDSHDSNVETGFAKQLQQWATGLLSDEPKVEQYRSSIEITGLQKWSQYKNVLVTTRGNLLTFSADDKTQQLKHGDVLTDDLGWPFRDTRNNGEWFSVLFSRNGSGTVTWGHMQEHLSPSVIRECR